MLSKHVWLHPVRSLIVNDVALAFSGYLDIANLGHSLVAMTVATVSSTGLSGKYSFGVLISTLCDLAMSQ